MDVHQKQDVQAALTELDQWQDPVPADKQRRFRRFDACGQARLRTGHPTRSDAASSDPTVLVRDISRGGASVLMTAPAPLGTHWQIDFTRDQVVVGSRPGVCRYCREVVNGMFLVGVEFAMEASLLVSLGVGAANLADHDASERDHLAGSCVPGSAVADEQAA